MTEGLKGTPMPPELRSTFESMVYDLGPNGQRLEIEKREAPDQRHSGHGIRVKTGENAEWYRMFAGMFTAGRKKPRTKGFHDTLVKRRDTRQIMERWLKNGTTRSRYAEALIECAEFENERMAEEEEFWQEQLDAVDAEGEIIPPSNDEWDDDVPF